MSGSHRTNIRRPADRRVGLVIAGVAAGVVACVVAAAVVLNTVIATGSPAELANGSRVESSPVSSRPEQGAVPDACSVVPAELTGRLVPGAHVTQNDPFEANDQASQCTWGIYGDRGRQLTVQLRAVSGEGGDSGATIAARELQSERRADEAGEGLRAGQKVTRKEDVESIGDEGYAVYSRVTEWPGANGEGIVNVRAGSILITVHFSGVEGENKPVSDATAIDGATEAAQQTIKAL